MCGEAAFVEVDLVAADFAEADFVDADFVDADFVDTAFGVTTALANFPDGDFSLTFFPRATTPPYIPVKVPRRQATVYRAEPAAGPRCANSAQ